VSFGREGQRRTKGDTVVEGKVTVITGAGSGVGRASALAFGAAGAPVVCADVNLGWAEETARLVGEAGGTARAQLCDVTKEADVVAAIEGAVEAFGRLDVMFNNAGVATPRPGMGLLDHSFDDWERLMAINLRGVFFGMKHAVAQFRTQGGGGAIVNTGSVAGMVGWGGTVYGASKGGVNQLTKGVAIECAPEDIRVNAICPAGMPFTNFMVPDAAEGSTGVDRAIGDAVGQMHPLGRPITAEDCAAAALFLASDAARNITGVLLPVDGGYVAR
jgi:NAD(P)-dependent dehydrogenase (short-subunit alcohol dehydrogenase family)